MKTLPLIFIFCLLSLTAFAQSRIEVLEDLQNWRQETAQRQDLEEREKDLRLLFVNRLLFQVESKYQDKDLTPFLIKTLKEMNKTDQNITNQSLGGMNEFLENLQLSLEDSLEPRENVIGFMQAFTDFSGIEEPATADEFANTRNYFNGRVTEEASPSSYEEAAQAADLWEQKSASPLNEAWLDFHQDLNADFFQKNQIKNQNKDQDRDQDRDQMTNQIIDQSTDQKINQRIDQRTDQKIDEKTDQILDEQTDESLDTQAMPTDFMLQNSSKP